MMEMIASSKLFHSHSSGEQPLGRLSEGSYIVRLNRIPSYKEIIAFLILERLYREMASLPDSPINEETGNRQIRTCIVIDEAHHYLGRNNEFLDKLIREGRSKGFVVILSSQSPKDYRQKFDYGQFIENKFIFKCQVNKGELQNLIKSDDATAARMVQEVMNLPKGDCLFNHSTSSKQSFTRLRASSFTKLTRPHSTHVDCMDTTELIISTSSKELADELTLVKIDGANQVEAIRKHLDAVKLYHIAVELVSPVAISLFSSWLYDAIKKYPKHKTEIDALPVPQNITQVQFNTMIQNIIIQQHISMKKTRHIVHISTRVGTQCEHCTPLVQVGLDDFAKSVNHYIEKHGYTLLHVGTETSHDSDGKLWHSTIALLGK